MPDNQRAIADTSVLIAFEKLNKLDLLCLTYKEVFLPEAVYQEYANDLQNCFILKTAPEPISNFLINHVGLGRGESESIALAHSMGTRALWDHFNCISMTPLATQQIRSQMPDPSWIV